MPIEYSGLVKWLLILTFGVFLPAICTAGYLRAPVTRERLEKFASRHWLRITPDNGGAVIRYLATTRRWRGWGLCAGFVLQLVVAITRHGRVSITSLSLLAGWFVGAVIAEWRVAAISPGRSPGALLSRRVASDYVPIIWLWTPYAALLLSTAVAGWAAALEVPSSTLRSCVAALAVAAAIVAVLRVAAHRILQRPQPAVAPDVLAADDSIRARSLHVLVGAGLTLALYAVLAQLAALRSVLPAASGNARFITAAYYLGQVLGPLLGYVIATEQRIPRRPILTQAAPSS
jgi:hypothetical protein